MDLEEKRERERERKRKREEGDTSKMEMVIEGKEWKVGKEDGERKGGGREKGKK